MFTVHNIPYSFQFFWDWCLKKQKIRPDLLGFVLNEFQEHCNSADCITSMAQGSLGQYWFMADPDLLDLIFQQLSPSEEAFRYLTFLACVCKCWKECARNTRSNSTWLMPFHTRGISYLNALKNAKSDLNLDAFTSGMVEYCSSQTIQEAILELMLEPVGESVNEKMAINHRFRSAEPSSLLSNIIKIFKRHMESVSVFVAVFKIAGILLLMDKQEYSTARTDVIAANDLFALIIEGAVLHKDTINVLHCEACIKALSMTPTGNFGHMPVVSDYMESFPAVTNLKYDKLIDVYNMNDDFSIYYNMALVDFCSFFMQTGICFEVENCKILQA